MSQPTPDFFGTDRFRIRRRLGSGGMGVVYEAYDCETDKLVALKTLSRSEPALIARFKKEFRSLADVSHPNLVSLYEFMSDGQHWFFTMELVQGTNFLEYVRPGYLAKRIPSSKLPTILRMRDDLSAEEHEAETQELSGGVSTGAESTLDHLAPFLAKSPLDCDRLSDALKQLALGLSALHETGKLHRDIKPSNVLVTREGRVVILDFGLVAEVEGRGLHQSVSLVGTPDYMSPEQCAQLPISDASDWYSVGVMLYQALFARLPFSGSFFQVMMAKQKKDPAALSKPAADIPEELQDLCRELLHRDPRQRASGEHVLRRLTLDISKLEQKPPVPSRATPTVRKTPFIGRRKYLDELRKAFASTRRGLTATVYLHGNSGMGKTALVRHYLADLRAENSDVVILEGRCYERESVPYKAIDGVIDSLTKHLMELPKGKAEALMPRDVLALARLFPVLLQVECIAQAPQRERETPDPFALRRRGFAALQEMLGRISDRQPLVLYIDDLQWSDADSISLLEELLRPPDAPPLLLIASFRTEDIDSRPFLKSLPRTADSETCRTFAVTPLATDDAHELVFELLNGDKAAVPKPVVYSIVQEAQGNPFLLEQLARYALTSKQTETSGISLGVMLDAQLRFLPAGAREFIDTLAIAGRPINPEVVFKAAGLIGDELPLVSSLRASHFLRSGVSDHTVELYHDRIREALVAQQKTNEVRRTYLRLARALEGRNIDDPETLFEYYLGAGERERAASHAAVAARKAAGALAFDRAVALYRQSLELAAPSGEELLTLKRELADALVNAGRPAEAAQMYLELARATSENRSLDFRRRAAEQLLMGGHIKEGLELTRSVLTAIGFTFPRGQKRALLSLVSRRLFIRMRGLNFVERDISGISEADLFRIDTCWSIAAGLGAVDLIRGADFHCRHLLLALRAGEPSRVARAIAFETAQSVSPGGRARERGVQLIQKAQQLAQRVGSPHAVGLSIWADGIAAYLAGQWKKGAELLEQAAEILRDQCTGVAWELGMAQRFMLSAMLYLGEVAEVARRVPDLLNTALDQGNIFFATDLRTRMNPIWLAADDPDRARTEVIEALKVWPQEGFHLQHYSALLAFTQIELYTNDAEVAWKHVQGQWKQLQQSMLLHNQVLRIEATHLLGRAALASARNRDVSAAERESRVKTAAKTAQRIAKEKVRWATGFVDLLRAGVASQRSDRATVVELLERAVDEFERADMRLYAAAARRRLGEALGGERGQLLLNESESWMRDQQIADPESMTRMLAPGF